MLILDRIRGYRMPAAGVFAALALTIGVTAPLTGAPASTPASIADLPPMDESRAAATTAVAPSVRGLVDPRRNQILTGQVSVDGFEPIADSAYDPIRAMARRTNMPPYQKY